MIKAHLKYWKAYLWLVIFCLGWLTSWIVFFPLGYKWQSALLAIVSFMSGPVWLIISTKENND
jgi:hypothetical protein